MYASASFDQELATVRLRFFAMIFGGFLSTPAMAAGTDQTFDLGIESMRSHSYSVGIFAFMMIAIAVFVGIIWAFMGFTKGEKIKKGEYVLFAMIILGVIAAAIFAAMQLLDGILF